MLHQDLFHDWLNSDVRHCIQPNIDRDTGPSLYIGWEILATQTITFLNFSLKLDEEANQGSFWEKSISDMSPSYVGPDDTLYVVTHNNRGPT